MSKIVSARIHPGLGIARLGDSDDYVLAPQVTTPAPRKPGDMHKDGLLKREAIEFRIYGYDEDGNVVQEITASEAEIDWHIHLVAKKASWYKFRAAMDLDGAADYELMRRNPEYTGDRKDLEINPGHMTVSGPGVARQELSDVFTWEGQTTDVTIGEIETDAKARLIVLGGRGRSGSPAGLPPYVDDSIEEDSFGNATGWYDEICDGPVTATVKIDGEEIACLGAWAAVAPPNYAPDFLSWRTFLDMCEEVWIDAGMMQEKPNVSFARDVMPLLQRMSKLQWLNRGFLAFFGPGGPLNFEDPDLIDKLRKIHGPTDVYGPLRRQIFNAFRPMENEGSTRRSLPWIFGDGFGSLPDSDPRVNLPLWPRAARKLKLWAEGDFDADWPLPTSPVSIDTIPLTDQPDELDRAALTFCLADAFHPGIELTWPMRHATIWAQPFRVRHRVNGSSEPDYGNKLTTERALGPDGPLHAQEPGGLTRWMALPWQVDTTGCGSGYDKSYDPFVPTFWPARVPNQVLTQAAYDQMMDRTLSQEERFAAFYDRKTWYHVLIEMAAPNTRLSFTQLVELMIQHFSKMGVVEQRDGPNDLPGIPNKVYVETLPEQVTLGVAPPALVSGQPMAAPSDADRVAQAAGWQDDAQREEFIAVRTARVRAMHRAEEE